MKSFHRYNTIRSSRDGSFPALLNEEGGYIEKPKKTSSNWLKKLKCSKPTLDEWEHHIFDEESTPIADDDRTFVVTDSEPAPIKRYYCSPVRRSYQYKREALDITDSTAETATEDDRTTGPVSVDDFIMLDDTEHSSEYMSGSSSTSSEELPVSTSNTENEADSKEIPQVRIGIRPFEIPTIPISPDEAPNRSTESSIASDLSDDDGDDLTSENDDKSNSELYHYNFEMDVSAALSRIEEVSEYTRSSVSVDESHGGNSALALPLIQPDAEQRSISDEDLFIEEITSAPESPAGDEGQNASEVPTTEHNQVHDEESSLAHDHAFEDRYLGPTDDEHPVVLATISSGENTVHTSNSICRPRREDLTPISRPPEPSVMANSPSPRYPSDASETSESAKIVHSPGRLRLMALINKFEQQSVSSTPPRNGTARPSQQGSVRFSDDESSSNTGSPPREQQQKSFFWRSHPDVSPVSKSPDQTKSYSSSSDEDVDLEDCRAIIHKIRENLIRRGSLKNIDEI